MFQLVVLGITLLAYVQQVSAECANACNGHGKCTSFDMCICNRNWQAADCSERVCQFGLAHVDTPKGDLNGDGIISNANEVVIDNNYVYPYGTTEQFPQMQNSDLEQIFNSAHYYMECSNKGRCDRTTGECQCFEGYDGVACQRASCPGYPNSCSGHGVCKTIRQLAHADYENVYELWDKDSTMGCECDKGYFGPDCSQRQCKFGIDPLYLDDAATVKFSIFDVAIITTNSSNSNDFSDNVYDTVDKGYWALRFYDAFEEDWVTTPIVSGATCAQVVAALEALPNNVIPSGTLECTRSEFSANNGTELTFSTNSADGFYLEQQNPRGDNHPYQIVYRLALWEAQTSALYGEFSPDTSRTPYFSSFDNKTDTISLAGNIYRLKFYGNPGKLRQPEVDVYLDGDRPTLLSLGYKVITKVWTDGQQGEFEDYFADHCAGVTVTIANQAAKDSNGNIVDVGYWASYLSGFSGTEKALLKACLGNADFNTSNNVDVYNWDYGNKLYPHIIKLVRTVTTYIDGGYYAALWYDTTGTFQDNLRDGTAFRLLNPFYAPDAYATDNYDVYTTTGILALTSELSQATFGFASQYIFTTNVSYDLNNTYSAYKTGPYPYDGDISCEVGPNDADKFNYIYYCLNRSDIFTMLNWEFPELNPPHINLYTAMRVKTLPFAHSVNNRWPQSYTNYPVNTTMHYLTHAITSDLSTNWGASVGYMKALEFTAAKFHVYKFFPAAPSTYEYVAECSNRGICDRDQGTCNCFAGYTSDACDSQSSLAL